MTNERITLEQWAVLKFLQQEGYSAAYIWEKVRLKHVSNVQYWMARDHPPGKAPPPPLDGPARRKMKELLARRELVEHLITKTVTVIGTRLTPKKRLKRTRLSERRPYGSPSLVARCINQTPEFLEKIGLSSVSASTIRRDLKALGLKAYKIRKGPRLTEACRAARVAFCKACLKRPDLAARLVFTDEKWFDSDDRPGYVYARDRSSVPVAEVEKGGPKVMVWGAIGVGFRRLVRIPVGANGKGAIKINEATYTKIVGPACMDVKKAGLVFQQDNAPGHVAAANHGWFKRRRIELLAGWPGNSPDLSPIETLWAILARRVADRGPFGADELWEFAKDEFEKVSDESLNSLVMEFLARCEACVEKKGAVVGRGDVKKFVSKRQRAKKETRA